MFTFWSDVEEATVSKKSNLEYWFHTPILDCNIVIVVALLDMIGETYSYYY